MTASRLSLLTEVVEVEWRDVPFQDGRMPFDVRRCPSQSAYFACLEPLREMLAPAFRAAAFERLERTEAASASVQRLMQAVKTAYNDGVSHEDLLTLAQDYAADVPASAPCAW